MQKNKTIITTILILVIITGVFFWVDNNGPQSTKNNQKQTKIKISYLPIAQSLPFYIALEKGYFEDEGLKVKPIRMGNPNQIVNSLISGQTPISASAATGIAGIAETKKPDSIRIFMLTGGNKKVENDAILVKKDSDISSIKDLKGKKMGILPSRQWRTIAKHILSENDLKAGKDVKLVKLKPGNQPSALASGQIDALLGVQPAPTIVKTKGIGKSILNYATAKEVSNPFYGGAGVVNKQFAKNNPNTTKKVLKVFTKSIKEIRANPTSSRKYLKKYTPLKGRVLAELPLPIFTMYDEFSQKDRTAVSNFYNIFVKNKVMKEMTEPRDIFYSQNNQ
ncbi:MAG: ABC transporter substrate-binding protein [Candidatus Paceibacteria bacterium]